MSFIVILQRSYCYHKKTCSAIYIDVSNVSRLQNSTRYGSRFIFSVPFAQICHRKTKVRRTSNDDLHTYLKVMSLKLNINFLKYSIKYFAKYFLARVSGIRGKFNENSNDNKLRQKTALLKNWQHVSTFR